MQIYNEYQILNCLKNEAILDPKVQNNHFLKSFFHRNLEYDLLIQHQVIYIEFNCYLYKEVCFQVIKNHELVHFFTKISKH